MTFGTLALSTVTNFGYVFFAISIAAIFSCLVGYLCELVFKLRHTNNRNWLVCGNALVGCLIPAVTLVHWFVDGKNLNGTNFDIAVVVVASAVLAPLVAALVFIIKSILCRVFAFGDALMKKLQKKLAAASQIAERGQNALPPSLLTSTILVPHARSRIRKE